jgi:hypothetical protein
MAAGPGSRPTENEVARRLWKETHGLGRRRPQRPALRRPHGVATSSDPKSEDMSATPHPSGCDQSSLVEPYETSRLQIAVGYAPTLRLRAIVMEHSGALFDIHNAKNDA